MKIHEIVILVIILFVVLGNVNMQRSPMPTFGFSNKLIKIKENSLEYRMQMALLTTDPNESYNKVEELLKEGASPDKKAGQFKWIDTNPLWDPRCIVNTKLAELFILYGANVKKRPYVARYMDRNVIADKNPRKKLLDFYKDKNGIINLPSESEIYSACEILLKAGADPNMMGGRNDHVLLIATNWNYLHYYKKHGMSPINLCIKENLLTIFPLLIEYGAILDKKSLELAEITTERTGSLEMKKLVLAQWKKQNKNKHKS